jgi:hypothetical protein
VVVRPHFAIAVAHISQHILSFSFRHVPQASLETLAQRPQSPRTNQKVAYCIEPATAKNAWLGVAANQSDRISDEHKNYREHHRVFGNVLAVIGKTIR